MINLNIRKEFNCSIEKIWNVITNNNDYLWRSDLKKIEIVDESHFIEYDKNNYPTYFKITSKKRLKEYKFELENTNIFGTWIGTLKENENGVVILDCTYEVTAKSKLKKIVIKPYLKISQQRYMKDLERKVYEQI